MVTPISNSEGFEERAAVREMHSPYVSGDAARVRAEFKLAWMKGDTHSIIPP
jgi:hypothetical protein